MLRVSRYAGLLCGLASAASLLALALLLYLGPVAPTRADQAEPAIQPDTQTLPITFATVEVSIDPQGKPLAAYQLELTSANNAFKVVGIESSDHAAYPRKVDYDLNAQNIQTDRLILANYTTAEAEQLPREPTRVATVHIALLGPIADGQPTINAKLIAAYGPDGEAIQANITTKTSTPQ